MSATESFVRFKIEWPSLNERASNLGQYSNIPTSINYGTIFTALHTSAQERYFPYLPDFLIGDGIKDAHELVEAFITKVDSEENEANVSSPVILRPHFFNGQKYHIQEETFTRCNPIAERTLRLIMHAHDDTVYHSLTFPHQYILWKWFYLLRMYHRVWRGECQKGDLGNIDQQLKTSGVLLSSSGIMASSNNGASTPLDVTVMLDIDNCFKLTLDENKILPLNELCSIILSNDCYPETGLSIVLTPSQVTVDATSNLVEKKRPSFTAGMVSTVAQLAEEATFGAAKRAKHVVQGTASLLASAVQAKKADTVETSFWGKRQKDCLFLKYLNSEQVVDTKEDNQNSTASSNHAFQLDYFIPTSKMMASLIRFPYDRCDALLYYYKLGSLQPLAATILEYEQLENWTKISDMKYNYRDMDRVSRLMMNFSNPCREMSTEISIDVDSAIDLSVTILRADGLVLNPASAFLRNTIGSSITSSKDISTFLIDGNNQNSISITAKCRLVNSGRHMIEDLGHSSVGVYNADTNSVEWGNASWKYKLQANIEQLRFIRVELSMIINNAGMSTVNSIATTTVNAANLVTSLPLALKTNHEGSLGAIFIPLSAVTHHAKELVFPVDDFRNKYNLLQPNTASITVLVQLVPHQLRLVDNNSTSDKDNMIFVPKAFPSHAPSTSSSTSPSSPVHVQCTITAQSYAPDDIWYPCDAMLTGDTNARAVTSNSLNPVSSLEKINVRFGRRALMVETNQELLQFLPEWSSLKVSQPEVYEYLWRKAFYSQQQPSNIGLSMDATPAVPMGHIIRTCQEAQAKSSQVTVDYQAIEKVEVISPGLIALTVTLNRFFPVMLKDKESNNSNLVATAAAKSRFVPVSMELFVYNVKSKHIALLLDDRRHFASIRKNFLSIVLGNQYEDEDARASDAVVLSIEMDHLATACRSDVHRLLDNVTDAEIAQMVASGSTFLSSASLPHSVPYNGHSNNNQISNKNVWSANTGEQYDPATGSIPIDDTRSSKRLPMQVWSEVRKVGSRESRLRMYEAALYGIGLQGAHDFNPEHVQALLTSDIAQSQAILLQGQELHMEEDPSVRDSNKSSYSTSGMSGSSKRRKAEEDAAERFASACQFLVNMAEKRIRETAIAGWSRRGEGKELDRCLVMLIEGYFNAILETMRPIFMKKHFDEIQGLQVKLRYITFVLQHHDQWKTFLASALRPYRLQVSPEPRISSYIHPERLISWYHDSIRQDMLLRLRHIFQVWQEQATNSSQTSTSLYQCQVVPWIPQREQVDSGSFFSGIPEDWTSISMIYMQYSVFRVEDIHPRYTTLAENAQRDLLIIYFQMFRALCDGYEAALTGSSLVAPSSSSASISPVPSPFFSTANNPNKSDIPNVNASNTSNNQSNNEPKKIVLQSEQMAAEYATWLCSVANDCYRILQTKMIVKDLPSLFHRYLSEEKVARELQKAYRSLQTTIHHAMEQLSSIIFHVIFQERGRWVTFDNIIQNIISPTTDRDTSKGLVDDTMSDNNGTTQPSAFVPLTKDIRRCLEDFALFLHPDCVVKYLVPICEDRLTVFLLSWLRSMRNRGLCITNIDENSRQQATLLRQSVGAEISALISFREKLSRHLSLPQSSVDHVASLLHTCEHILFSDINSPEFIIAFKEVINHSKTFPEDGSVMLRWLKVLLSLRGFTQYFTKSITMTKAVGKVRENASSAAAVIVNTAAAPVMASNVIRINDVASDHISDSSMQNKDNGNVDESQISHPVVATTTCIDGKRPNMEDASKKRFYSFPVMSAVLATAANLSHMHLEHDHDRKSIEERKNSNDYNNIDNTNRTSSNDKGSGSQWRPLKQLWQSNNNPRQSKDSSKANDTPHNKESVPDNRADSSDKDKASSFWGGFIFHDSGANDHTAKSSTLLSSQSGKFTAEMDALREQMQLEWIYQSMQELATIADAYQQKSTSTSAITESEPAASYSSSDKTVATSNDLTKPQKFRLWKRGAFRHRRRLLRLYRPFLAIKHHSNVSQLPDDHSKDKINADDTPLMLKRSKSWCNEGESQDEDSLSDEDYSLNSRYSETVHNGKESSENIVENSKIKETSGGGSKSNWISDIELSLLHWCLDSKQFNFNLTSIFLVHSTVSSLAEIHITDINDNNGPGFMSGRLLFAMFGMNQAVTQATQSAVNNILSLAPPNGISINTNLAAGITRPWKTLFARFHRPIRTASADKGYENIIDNMADSDKTLLATRDATLTQRPPGLPKLTLAEELDQLDVEKIPSPPTSPGKLLTAPNTYRLTIRRLRVLGTLHFVLFSAPSFVLQLRLGPQVFLTRTAPMQTIAKPPKQNQKGESTIDEKDYLYEFLKDDEEITFNFSCNPQQRSEQTVSSPALFWWQGKDEAYTTLQVTLMDTGVLVDQTLATLKIPLLKNGKNMKHNDDKKGILEVRDNISESEILPFSSFSSALRVQRAVKLAQSSNNSALLPRIVCDLTIKQLS